MKTLTATDLRLLRDAMGGAILSTYWRRRIVNLVAMGLLVPYRTTLPADHWLGTGHKTTRKGVRLYRLTREEKEG